MIEEDTGEVSRLKRGYTPQAEGGVNIDSLPSETTGIMKQPIRLRFESPIPLLKMYFLNQMGEEIGRIYETRDGQLAFEGNWHESARQFVEFCRANWGHSD